MSRKIRCIISHLPHHALQRGNNRQDIFPESKDKEYFLKQLKKYAQENRVAIGAYCLMTNHFHLLIYPEAEEGLVKLMKNISQIYTHEQLYDNKKDLGGKTFIEDLKKRFHVDFEVRKRGRPGPVKKK